MNEGELKNRIGKMGMVLDGDYTFKDLLQAFEHQLYGQLNLMIDEARTEFPTGHTVFQTDPRNVIVANEMNAILKEKRDAWALKWLGEVKVHE